MKNFFNSLKKRFCLLAVLPAQNWIFEIDVWQRVCETRNEASSCTLPERVAQPVLVEIKSDRLEGRQSAQMHRISFEIGDREQRLWSGELRLFKVIPGESSGFPAYTQTQFEIFHPYPALCMSSVRFQEPSEWPPQTCVAFAAGSVEAKQKQFGFNLRLVEQSSQ